MKRAVADTASIPSLERVRFRLDLIEPATLHGSQLQNGRARQHLTEGFNRRVYMMEASALALQEVVERKDRSPLGPYEATELAVQLNALYLNLCGAIDNLGWAVQHEWSVLGLVNETDRRRLQVSFRRSSFIDRIAESRPELSATIRTFLPWLRDLHELRDPAAHRIPLYVPPGTITDSEQLLELQRLNAEASAAFESGQYRQGMDLSHRARHVGTYMPVMVLSHEDRRLEVRAIPAQVSDDSSQFIALAHPVLAAMIPGWSWPARF
jgi:hypothetical protein